MAENITTTLPCPQCGRDCQWSGTPRDGGGTTWRIDCDCAPERRRA